jgi:hypothetical protein
VWSRFLSTRAAQRTPSNHIRSRYSTATYLNGCANWGLSAQRGAIIFSLADPDNPAFAGEYAPNYFHDSYVRNDTIYGASVYSGGGIYIADIHNKAAPIPIGKISYAGSGTHNLWTTTDGKYLISTDEIGGTPKILKFWDLQGLPAIPTGWSSSYQITPSDIEHNVFVRGNYAYTAWYTAGIAIADIHEPLAPFTAGFYDTSNDTLYPRELRRRVGDVPVISGQARLPQATCRTDCMSLHSTAFRRARRHRFCHRLTNPFSAIPIR